MRDDADRIACVGQRRVQRIVVGNGRDTAQQVLQAAVQQATVTSDFDHRPERAVGAQRASDIRDPFAGHSRTDASILDVREAVELQMVVGIDQPGQQSIACQVDDPVRGPRVASHGRDPRSDDTHRRRSVIDASTHRATH